MIFSEMHRMNARIHGQGINIRKKRIEKIGADSAGLLLMEPVTVEQILACRGEDSDLHEVLSRMFLLVASQS